MTFSDADNTLWDTDKVYADAQLNLLENVESFAGANLASNDRLGYLREIDQNLASQHHAGLRYPPTLLAIALGLNLKGALSTLAVKAALKQGRSAIANFPADEIATAFNEDLKRLASLRPGVQSGLEMLHDSGEPVSILTEGHRDRCEKLLQHYHLRDLVDRIIEGKKTLGLFKRLRNLGPTNENLPPIIIGDQIDRDILPGKEAGFIAIYFPGGFVPKWTPMDSVMQADYQVKGFDEAARIVLRTRSANWESLPLISGARSA